MQKNTVVDSISLFGRHCRGWENSARRIVEAGAGSQDSSDECAEMAQILKVHLDDVYRLDPKRIVDGGPHGL